MLQITLILFADKIGSHRRCSVKKVYLEISQNSQENTCARLSFLIKLQTSACNLFKKRLWRRFFPLNFAKFLRTPFFTERLRWLLLRERITIPRIRKFFSSENLLIEINKKKRKQTEAAVLK